MLSTFRSLARPLSALLTLVFLAPAAVVECQGAAMSSTATMACCHKTSDAPAMDPNCCAVQQPVPPRNEPATVVSLRSFERPLFVALPPSTALVVFDPLTSLFADPVNTGPPRPDRLYLRLSALRR